MIIAFTSLHNQPQVYPQMFIRGKLRQGITDTNRTIAKIDAFGSGMREAGQMAANTFKTFVDKPVVGYAER